MNRIYQAFLIVASLGLPLASHAQSQSTVTRAQVRAELVAAELSGQYPPSNTGYPEPENYPVAAPHVFRRSHDVTAASYGPSANGSADSGFRATRARSFATSPIGLNDIYRGQ